MYKITEKNLNDVITSNVIYAFTMGSSPDKYGWKNMIIKMEKLKKTKEYGYVYYVMKDTKEVCITENPLEAIEAYNDIIIT